MTSLLLVPALPVLLAITLGSLAALVGVTFVRPVAKVVSSIENTAIPTPKTPEQTTFIYDRDGKFVTSLASGINRTVISATQMPVALKEAVIAIEDKKFYTEGGVSVEGTLRAALTDLIHHRAVQGGSTITQQYVKLVYTGDQRTLSRKLREAVIAEKLSHIKTKDQILTDYLNTVYFGNNAYGAQAAAKTYWHKSAHKLSVPQAAMLAAMVQRPVDFDPYAHPQDLLARRNLVLQDMAAQGYITPADATKYQATPIKVEKPGVAPVPAAYFVDTVSRTLQTKYGVDSTFHGGLRVRTTLDTTYQQAAESAIASHLSQPNDPSAALVAIDPGTGAIRAMVGGRDFTRVKFNYATQARRQTGSAAKPFTFATAMMQHFNPDATLPGPPELVFPNDHCYDPTKNQPWDVHNFADETAGTMSLFNALAHSVNTIFAQLVVDVGPEAVVKTMHRLGVNSHLDPVCSITLGSQAITPLEMTEAYATLADHGVHHSPTTLDTVKDSTGHVLYQLRAQGTQAIDANAADLTVKAMEGVVQFGTGTAANIGRPVAGKTGTGQNFQDAWFCGFVPQLVACVWVGYPKGEIPMHDVEGFADVFGGSIPAEIWHDFMQVAVQDLPVESFVEPSLVGYDQTPEPISTAPLPAPTFVPTFAPPPPPQPQPSPTPHRCRLHPHSCQPNG